jgi:hypothetical protein
MASKRKPARRLWVVLDEMGVNAGNFYTKKYAIEDARIYGSKAGWTITGPYVLAPNATTTTVVGQNGGEPR